jgi:hypothetical protein
MKTRQGFLPAGHIASAKLLPVHPWQSSQVAPDVWIYSSHSCLFREGQGYVLSPATHRGV